MNALLLHANDSLTTEIRNDFSDVVRAYKSIESEKKALEVALFALSDNTTAADESKTEGGISSSVQKDVESSGNSNVMCIFKIHSD